MYLNFMAVDVCFVSRFEVWCPSRSLSFHSHFSVSFTAIYLPSIVPGGWTFHFTGFQFAFLFISF